MSKRILLADDDQYIRELYQEILIDEGYSVDTVINGEEAAAKMQVGGYDLIILDIIMPKMDGFGALDATSKNPPRQPNGPVILLTNLGQEPIREEIKRHGIAACLVKAEITPDQLIQQVKKFLPD